MAYVVLEALRPNGTSLAAEQAVLLPPVAAATPLGAYPTWKATLRAVARVEARARRESPGSDLALVIIKSARRAS